MQQLTHVENGSELTVLRVARVVLPAGIGGPHQISIVNGQIFAIEPISPANTGDIDDVLLSPGFIDMQVNGIGRHDVASASLEAFAEIDSALLSQGTTTWCPTIVSSAPETYSEKFDRVAAAIKRAPSLRPHLAGLHLEGPFLGGAPGAHDQRYSSSHLEQLIDDLPQFVRVVTIAPENRVGLEAICKLKIRNIVVSIGHSLADTAQLQLAVDAGATLVTHLFNAMSGVHHREPSVALFALTEDRLAAGLIADLVHVSARAINLAFRAKPGNIVLVTDAIAATSTWAVKRGIEIRNGAPRLADGTLAGSVLKMNEAIQNCVTSGIAEHSAFMAATREPARILGLTDRGVLDIGMRADLVAVDSDYGVRTTWIGGQKAFSK